MHYNIHFFITSVENLAAADIVILKLLTSKWVKYLTIKKRPLVEPKSDSRRQM